MNVKLDGTLSSRAVVLLFLLHCLLFYSLLVFFCVFFLSLCLYAALSVLSSVAIISLIDLVVHLLFSRCHMAVYVLCFFLKVPRANLYWRIVASPDRNRVFVKI